jgi:hypothetical protein
MSIRTVIEINHDYLYNWENHPEEAAKILWSVLCGGERIPEHTVSVYGIRVLIQRHHSTKCTIEVE